MEKLALVLGATGGIGGETARALLRHGWAVRGLSRTIHPGLDPAITWIEGDAMDAAAVLRAATGVDVIVHAVNPPGYRNWSKLVLPMIDNSIAAARANNARIALPGTIYNYDPAAVSRVAPDAPQHPTTRKGRIRVEMEQRLEASGVRVLILRAGDFFGPRPGNSWLSQGMITPGKPVAKITNPAFPGVGHSWAYLPDVAETFARLLDAEERLKRFSRHHVAGYWDRDGTAFTSAVAKAAGGTPRIVRLPWLLLRFVAPFNETIRELLEMRMFWEHPLQLDNATLTAVIGEEPHTQVEDALAATLDALGRRAATAARR